MINIFCDGGCIVGKGIGAISFVVVDMNKVIYMESILIDGLNTLTNNQCEYKAIIEVLYNYGLTKDVTIYSDSEIVVKQINGEYEVREPTLKKLHHDVKLLSNESNVKFVNVPRENKYIQIADKMNKIIMNEAKNGNQG